MKYPKIIFKLKNKIQKKTNVKAMIIIPAHVNLGIVIVTDNTIIRIAIARKYEKVLKIRSEKHFFKKTLVGVR